MRKQKISRKKRRQQLRRRVGTIVFLGMVLLFIGIANHAGIWKSRGWVDKSVVDVQGGSIKKGLSGKKIKEMRQSGDYPESLLELAERNPEVKQFVLDYPEKKDKEVSIDISGEVAEGEIPLFLQWDERWGYQSYGEDMIAITGCGPTCLSMVYCGLTGDTAYHPLRMAQFAEENGYYVEGSGTAWDLMTKGARQLGLSAEELVFDEEHITSELRAGHPVICSMRPGDFTTAGHYIVLKGLDGSGDVCVCDPNSVSNSSRTWSLERIMPQIKNLWVYR